MTSSRRCAVVVAGLLLAGCTAAPSTSPPSPEPPGASAPPASTVSPSTTPTAAPSSSPAPTTATPVSCGTETAVAALTACWQRVTPAVLPIMETMVTATGRPWRPVRTVVFGTVPPRNPCETGGDGAAGSFSCARNRTVYLSTFEASAPTRAYVREAKKVPGVLAADAQRAGVPLAVLERGVPGQGQATIMVHELSHQVLDQSGYQTWFDAGADRYEPGSKRYDAYGFAPETAADCLTGATLAEAKRKGAMRMNALDQWGSRAWLAQTDPFNRERPRASPFRYRDEWRGEQYRGYGGAYWRLRAFDLGWRTPIATALTTCVDQAAAWKGITAKPKPAAG